MKILCIALLFVYYLNLNLIISTFQGDTVSTGKCASSLLTENKNRKLSSLAVGEFHFLSLMLHAPLLTDFTYPSLHV